MSETPMYLQIKAYLETVIRMNASIPNYRLPSENQLAKQFSVTNPTVRRAFAALEAEEKILRIQGKGAFVRGQAATVISHCRVCIVVPGFGDLFVQQLLLGASHYFEQQHIDAYVKFLEDDYKITHETYREVEDRQLMAAIRHDFHGMLVFPSHQAIQSKVYNKLAMSHYPIVEMVRFQPGLPISYVHCDHFQQTYKATRFLHERGHTRIAFLTEPADSSYTYADRVRGYRQYLHSHLGSAAVRLMELETFMGVRYDPVEDLNTLFTAHPDTTALMLPARFLRHLGVFLEKTGRTPPTVLVLDVPAPDVRALLPFDLYYLSQQPHLIGQQAAARLCEVLRDGNKAKEICIEPQLYYWPANGLEQKL